MSKETVELKTKEEFVRVKFNFPLANPNYDSSLAMKRAKEEKNHLAYTSQRMIDFSMVDFVYNQGTYHEIPKTLYERLSKKDIETYNPTRGNFMDGARKYASRRKIPFVLLVDSNGDLLNPYQEDLDLYPKKTKTKAV